VGKTDPSFRYKTPAETFTIDRMRGLLLLTVFAVTLLSCAGYGPFNGLPETQRARFERCWTSSLAFRANACAARSQGALDPPDVGGSQCRTSAEHRYVDQQGEQDRRLWLTESGCAARLVGRR